MNVGPATSEKCVITMEEREPVQAVLSMLSAIGKDAGGLLGGDEAGGELTICDDKGES